MVLHGLGVGVIGMGCIDEMGVRATGEPALAGLDRDMHPQVSFDVDCLDPRYRAGEGPAVPAGSTYREARLCMEVIADTRRVGSLEVVQFNLVLDVRNQTAVAQVSLVASLFSKSTRVRRPIAGPALGLVGSRTVKGRRIASEGHSRRQAPAGGAGMARVDLLIFISNV